MTIREFLWKKVTRSYLYWLSCYGAVLALLLLLPDAFSRAIWIPLAMLAIGIPFGFLMARILCPRCGYPFLKFGLLRIKLGSDKYRINHCPHCGVGLDHATDPNNSFEVTPSGAPELNR